MWNMLADPIAFLYWSASRLLRGGFVCRSSSVWPRFLKTRSFPDFDEPRRPTGCFLFRPEIFYPIHEAAKIGDSCGQHLE